MTNIEVEQHQSRNRNQAESVRKQEKIYRFVPLMPNFVGPTFVILLSKIQGKTNITDGFQGQTSLVSSKWQ